jgi:hypothetical protein
MVLSAETVFKPDAGLQNSFQNPSSVNGACDMITVYRPVCVTYVTLMAQV